VKYGIIICEPLKLSKWNCFICSFKSLICSKNSPGVNFSSLQSNDVTYTQNDDIIKQFVDFYTDLFTDEEIDDDVCNFFLEDLPVLDEFEKDLCDNPVTMDEILVSLKDMENSKSPGPY
jgi:hypothetical protein